MSQENSMSEEKDRSQGWGYYKPILELPKLIVPTFYGFDNVAEIQEIHIVGDGNGQVDSYRRIFGQPQMVLEIKNQDRGDDWKECLCIEVDTNNYPAIRIKEHKSGRYSWYKWVKSIDQDVGENDRLKAECANLRKELADLRTTYALSLAESVAEKTVECLKNKLLSK